MAARGSQAKEEITKKILEVFPGSFVDGKDIRIPWVEDADNLQIKINMTCAKVNVENAASEVSSAASPVQTNGTAAPAMVSPSDAEKARVKELLEKLNL